MPDALPPHPLREDGPEGASPECTIKSTRRTLSWKKKLLFRAAALCLALVVMGIVLELLLRLFSPQPLLPRYVMDSGFGIRVHCPNISIRHRTADYQIRIRTNSMGIRADREFAYAKPDGVFRIVALGDSFTFGYGVELEDTYLARLEHLLNCDGVNAEVINLGVAGHGTAEELVMLNQVGLRFDPDLVILAYYTNDIGDSTRSMLYRVDDDGQLVRREGQYLPGVKLRERLYSFALYRFLAERSHLLYFVRRNLSELMQKRLRAKRASTEAMSAGDEERLTAALLDEIKRTCTRSDVSFCMLDIPSARIKSNLPRAFLRDVSDEDIIDVRRVLTEHTQHQTLYWTRSDGHWTPAAHAIAAQAVLDYLHTGGTLDGTVTVNWRDGLLTLTDARMPPCR